MADYDGCAYCISNKHGHLKPLLVNTLNHYWDTNHIKGMSINVRDFVQIKRTSRHSHKYHLVNNRVSTERNPLKKTTYVEKTSKQGASIKFCPNCGRKLNKAIPFDHPIRQTT